jgi:hypothetical protein
MISLAQVADVHLQQKQFAEAASVAQEGLAAAERRAKLDPNRSEWQRDLGNSYAFLGAVLKERGDLAGALDNFRAACGVFERGGG